MGEIFDINNEDSKISIEALDEQCELYMLENYKRERLRDKDMAK